MKKIAVAIMLGFIFCQACVWRTEYEKLDENRLYFSSLPIQLVSSSVPENALYETSEFYNGVTGRKIVSVATTENVQFPVFIDFNDELKSGKGGYSQPIDDENRIIVACEIKLNPYFENKPEILVFVIEHEIGHCFGLAHNMNKDNPSLMSPFISYNSNLIEENMERLEAVTQLP